MTDERDNEARTNEVRKELFRAHSKMLIALFAATIAIVVVCAVVLIIANATNEAPAFPTLLFVFLAGALGAFVSAMQRSHAFEGLAPILLEEQKGSKRLGFLYIYALIPPLIGAISGVVVYVFFQSGLMVSPIFPDFLCKPDAPLTFEDCSELVHFMDYGPKTMADYAKAFVWAFAAGFSERLLPNIVARLAQKMDEAD